MSRTLMLDLHKEYEYMKEQIDSAIGRCLKHQRWIHGPEVSQLETEVSKYLGAAKAVGVASGTDALVISLRCMAMKFKNKEYFDHSDKIITTPFTFTASGDAILRSGGTPVFVDIDPQSYNIDVAKVRDYLADNHNGVVGIVAVHLYGQSCDMDALIELADQYDLFVVEDVAQAFGGKWKQQCLGTIGAAGAFSFFPSKNLGGFGDGGMIATDDDEIAEIANMLLRHGGKDKYNVEHVGYNSRLDTIQAAILLAKLKYIDEFTQKRRDIAKCYNDELAGSSWLSCPVELENAYHVYHQYTVRITQADRDEIKEILQQKEIGTAVYYPFALHQMQLFSQRAEIVGQLEQAECASRQVLSLPIEPLYSEEEIQEVCNCLKQAV